MKDELIVILEALRLSQAALADHIEPGGPSEKATIHKLLTILDDEKLMWAMQALYPDIGSPSMSPQMKITKVFGKFRATKTFGETSWRSIRNAKAVDPKFEAPICSRSQQRSLANCSNS